MSADRWNEFDKWCDEIIDSHKKNLDDIMALQKICPSDMLSNRIKYYKAAIKHYTLRKERYLKTGDSYSNGDPEIEAARKEMNKYEFLY